VTGEWLPPQSPGGPPAPPPNVPNAEAVAAMVCGLSGSGLIYFSDGMSTVLSLALGIVAVPFARKARRNVIEGRTRTHTDLTTAANLVAWITVAISLIATVAWGLVWFA
jgi:hypothetical protein